MALLESPGTSVVEGADVRPRVQIGLTPLSEKPKITLQQAARDGREDVVRQWLSRLPKYKKSTILDSKDAEGYTAMHYAAKFNRFQIMLLLATSGAAPDVETPEEKLTPLHLAARYIPRYHDEATFEEEQKEGATEAPPQSSQVTYLSSSKRAVQLLIHQKVNVNCKDIYGSTPLHMACNRGNFAAVEALLAARSLEVCATDASGDTPLHEACLYGDKRAVEKILRKMKEDGSTLLVENDEKETPLHFACKEGHSEIVKLIVHSGFDERRELVSAQDNEYNTPLHLACESGNDEIVRVLLLNGADIHAARNEDITPLHLAARYGYLKVAKTLLDSGLDIINVLDAFQQTPLHYAAKNNQEKMIDFLVEKGADIEAQDERSVSPLLTAASNGKLEAFQALLERGAFVDIVDKNGKSAVYLAAEANQINILRELLRHKTGAKLFCTVDAQNNTPLHVAAEKGNLVALKVLLQADIKEDARNELGKTPMHLAAERGHIPIVRELLRHNESTAFDEDEDSNSPLHLACTYGHVGVAKVLVDANADVEARNSVLWTPMDCAAAGGWEKVITLLIGAGAEIDPTDKFKVTPLHLACREGHLNVVDTLLTNGADVTKVDQNRSNALDLAIDHGHEDVALRIVNSPKWEQALRNVTPSLLTDGETTPLRKLIRKMPEVAEVVFNRCTLTNETKDGQVRPDSRGYTVTFTYEFLEDFRDPVSRAVRLGRALSTRPLRHGSEGSSEKLDDVRSKSGSVWAGESADSVEGTGAAKSQYRGYTTTWGPEGFRKSAHPLSIMVQSERIDLLKHPLVTSLLNHKWRTYGRYVYFGNLAIYLLFLFFLTTFALVILNPLSCTCQAVFDGKFGENESDPLCDSSSYDILDMDEVGSDCVFTVSGLVGNTTTSVTLEQFPSEGCECDSSDDVQRAIDVQTCGTCRGLSEAREGFLYVAAVVIIIFSIYRLVAETFQFFQLRLFYLLDWVNWIEVILTILSIMFVWVFHEDCLCPREWQWQVGTAAVFLAWIDLIIFIRKLPLTGIYVVMFIDIFYTFCKMIFLSALLVIAFGLAFYMAFFEPDIGRTPFSTPARALVKTMTMTTGEFEYDSIFRQSSNPLDGPGPELQFPPVSYILWIIFLILMPVLLTNLLVGLAVDDIKGVQEAAVLKRLALQVELALSVEELFPRRLRRYVIIGSREICPNRSLSLYERFRFTVWGGYRYDSPENITNALHPPLLPIEHVQSQNRTLMNEVEQMRQTLGKLAERNEALQELIQEMARKQGIVSDSTSADAGLSYM